MPLASCSFELTNQPLLYRSTNYQIINHGPATSSVQILSLCVHERKGHGLSISGEGTLDVPGASGSVMWNDIFMILLQRGIMATLCKHKATHSLRGMKVIKAYILIRIRLHHDTAKRRATLICPSLSCSM